MSNSKRKFNLKKLARKKKAKSDHDPGEQCGVMEVDGLVGSKKDIALVEVGDRIRIKVLVEGVRWPRFD